MVTKPIANNVDLGHKLRTRRKTIGMTQAQLAAAVGVSFQQMQKYEKGINAISSARLTQICDVLSLPQDFFETSAGPLIGKGEPATDRVDVPSHQIMQQFLASREGRRLIESFMRIQDKRLRTRILDFVASVAQDGG